eukprot:g1148.t1
MLCQLSIPAQIFLTPKTSNSSPSLFTSQASSLYARIRSRTASSLHPDFSDHMQDLYLCILHNVSKEGKLLPSGALALCMHCDQTLWSISLKTSPSRPQGGTPFIFDKYVEIPTNDFIDACMGLYSPNGRKAQEI